MEKLQQPQTLTNYLKSIQQKDSYNKFCVDCNKNESTHASVTYGILICEDCARLHMEELGMDKSYVKSLFQELWDDYQISCIQLGGNKHFWDFMKHYNMEWKPISGKFDTREGRYYRRKLSAQVQGKEFTEEQPARDVGEVFDRGVGQAQNLGKEAASGIKKFGTFLGDSIKSTGVTDKFKGLFGGKSE